MPDEPTTLKESLFKTEMVDRFAAAIHGVYPAFDREAFQGSVFDDSWEQRSLMERLRHVTISLHGRLPPGYSEALAILVTAAPVIPREGFICMVPSDFVAVYGLDDYAASVPALETFTQLVLAEFAVRPFIVQYPQQMMAQMLRWADHQHEGVRRLASEGCRPRLPWGIRLHALVDNPASILPILEKLKQDDSESVRRSVANNLNDISKDNPQIVLELLNRWNADEGHDQHIQWITAHALRTLVKAGDSQALELLGYPAVPQIEVKDVKVEPAVLAIGDKVTLTFTIESTAQETQKLMVDYIVYHLRANGRQTPKVFKLKKASIEPGQLIQIRKQHSFRPVTTRKYYPGAHGVQPQVNGRLFERVDFDLTDETKTP